MELTFVAKARRWTLDVCLLSPIFLTAPADLAMFQSRSVLSARRWEAEDALRPVSATTDVTDRFARSQETSDLCRSSSDGSFAHSAPRYRLCQASGFSVIGGIYDGADGDDSVVLVYETAAPSVPNEPPPPLFCCLQNISIESTVHGLPDGRFTRSVRSPLSALGSPIPSLVLNNHEYRIRRAPDQSRSAVVVSQPVVDRRRTPVRVLLITDRDLA